MFWKKSAPLKHRYWSCTAIATKLCPSTKASWFRFAAPQPKKFITLAGAGHNDTYLVASDRYFEQLRQSIEETAPPRR